MVCRNSTALPILDWDISAKTTRSHPAPRWHGPKMDREIPTWVVAVDLLRSAQLIDISESPGYELLIYRQPVNVHADCIVDGVRDGRRGRDCAYLADALRPVGAGRGRMLHDDRGDLWRSMIPGIRYRARWSVMTCPSSTMNSSVRQLPIPIITPPST